MRSRRFSFNLPFHVTFPFTLMALAPILAILALSSWALASPVGSGPDDDFHLASIWCAAGVSPTECATVPDPAARAVPGGILKGLCFAYKPAQSAACHNTSLDDQQSGLVTTTRANFTGIYPPLYYLSMHLFVTSNVAVSVILMRFVNILLLVGLATALAVLLPPNRRLPLLWGMAVSVVPLGMFLVASNNPSGWAIISAGTLWVALVGFFESSGAKKAGLGAIAVVSTLVGAGARADSAAYVAVAIAVAVLLTVTRRRSWLVSALLPLALTVVAAVLYLSAKQSSFASAGIPARKVATPGWHELLFTNFLNVPTLWAGVFGSSALGWLDTQMPGIVWVGSLGCFAAVIFAGLASHSTRKLLSMATVLGALWLIPTFTLVQSGVLVGSGVQPRYLLPLIIMLGGVSLWHVRDAKLRLSKAQIVMLVATLSAANATALHYNMRRYLTGIDVTGWNLNYGAEWWWSIPVSPMFIWALGSLSFAAFLGAITLGTMRSRPAIAVKDSLAAAKTSEPAPIAVRTPAVR